MKYTYIQIEIGYYEIDYKLNSNYKVGNSWQDYLDGDWVELNDVQLKFKENNSNASIEEVYKMEIVTPEPYVPTLDEVRNNKIAEITAYDSSSTVNEFTINGIPTWFDKDVRLDYFQSIVSAKAVGRKEVSFFVGDTMLSVDVNLAEQMLNQLQLYANDSFNVTATHKANVNKLTTIDEVEAYDYKVGYPVKLNFEIGGSDAKEKSTN